MNPSNKPRHVFVLATLLLTSMSGTACLATDAQTPRILVTGEASIALAPDMAMLNLTVTREADSAESALEANSSAMSQVLAAMQAEGVEARDLQTSDFSIQPKYVYPKPTSNGEREPPSIAGYTVRNSLNVRVRDIAKVGAILDRSIALGVNEGGHIVFTNDDPSAALTQARTEAMKNAMAKARTLADAAGVEVGNILEISEQSFTPRPLFKARPEMAMARAADTVPVAAGENSYRVTVNVSYAINQ